MKRLAWIPVVLLLFSACGSPTNTQEGPGSVELPEDISAATSAKGTARTFTKQKMSFDADGGHVIMTSVGTIDFETLRQEAVMTSKGSGIQGEMMAQQMGTMELVGEGLVIYFKSPFFQRMLPDAKDWLKMDMQAVGEQMGMDMGSLMQTNQADPTAPLDYLEGLEDIEVVGEEEVHGAPTTHYKGRASFDKLKEVLDPDAAATIDQLQALMEIDGFDVEAWIDEDGAARRLDYTYEALPMAGMSGEWNMMMEFFDFGIPVNIKLPPARNVTDMMQLLNDMEGGS